MNMMKMLVMKGCLDSRHGCHCTRLVMGLNEIIDWWQYDYHSWEDDFTLLGEEYEDNHFLGNNIEAEKFVLQLFYHLLELC